MLRPAALIPLIAAATSLFLAVVVCRRAPNRRVGRTFSLLAITLFFWNLNFVVLYSVSDYEMALSLTRIFRTGAIFVVPTILHLSLVLPGRTVTNTWRVILAVNYVTALGLSALNLQDLLVSGLAPYHWGYHSVGTTYYNVFSGLVVITFILSAGYLIYAYLTVTTPRTRLELKFWLFGIAVALPLGVTNLLPSYGINFYPLGNLGSAIWAGIVAYAIVRYRLMDIEIVVTKALAYVTAFLLTVCPSIVAVLGLQRLLFEREDANFSLAIGVLVPVSALLFFRLARGIERRLEQFLFPRKYAGRAALILLAAEVVKILDRERLASVICSTVENVFGLDRSELFLRDDSRGQYVLARGQNCTGRAWGFGAENPLLRWVSVRGEPLLLEEVASNGANDFRSRAKEMLVENGWEVCVPFVNSTEVIGLLCLGQKRGFQAYSTGDVELLQRLAIEAGIAFQNARMYEELRRSREIINRAGRLSALGTLAAGIAHEIRNPLVSIQTFFQLAPEKLEDEEFRTSFLKLAEGEVQRINSLITELLRFAKSPSRSLVPVELNELVDRAVLLIEPQARAQRVEVRSVLGRNVPQVKADPDQMIQVLINLALNGLEAANAGGRVTLETREVVLDGETFGQVEVSDNGKGISSDLREAIFDPFFTTKDNGTGLGLAVAHQIIVETGGFISVESVEGEGTQFFVNLPGEMGGGEGSKAER